MDYWKARAAKHVVLLTEDLVATEKMGHVDEQWADWFGGLTITLEESGNTLLTGPVPDQAALFGLLRRVPDLGMQLISVNCVDTGSQD